MEEFKDCEKTKLLLTWYAALTPPALSEGIEGRLLIFIYLLFSNVW